MWFRRATTFSSFFFFLFFFLLKALCMYPQSDNQMGLPFFFPLQYELLLILSVKWSCSFGRGVITAPRNKGPHAAPLLFSTASDGRAIPGCWITGFFRHTKHTLEILYKQSSKSPSTRLICWLFLHALFSLSITCPGTHSARPLNPCLATASLGKALGTA